MGAAGQRLLGDRSKIGKREGCLFASLKDEGGAREEGRNYRGKKVMKLKTMIRFGRWRNRTIGYGRDSYYS